MEKNELYPVFLKLEHLEVLIVGGGNVALEKLQFMLKSSPRARVTMIAPFYRAATRRFALDHGVRLLNGVFRARHLAGRNIVIATTDKDTVNEEVYRLCRERGILVNVADNPPYCDFYMGGIVTKGNVKIAISTNGKSPTMAKRLRQFLEQVLPDDINTLVCNLNSYRATLKEDFQFRVTQLNKFTQSFIDN